MPGKIAKLRALETIADDDRFVVPAGSSGDEVGLVMDRDARCLGDLRIAPVDDSDTVRGVPGRLIPDE